MRQDSGKAGDSGTGFTVFHTRQVENSLERIHAETRGRILKAIDGLAKNPRPARVDAVDGISNCYRIVVQKDYRILYVVDDAEKRLTILRVDHRSEAYKNLKALRRSRRR